jgi:hypothetical protein
MFEGTSSSCIHGVGLTPWRSARIAKRPLAACRRFPGSNTVPEEYSFLSIGSPAALRRSMSARIDSSSARYSTVVVEGVDASLGHPA